MTSFGKFLDNGDYQVFDGPFGPGYIVDKVEFDHWCEQGKKNKIVIVTEPVVLKTYTCNSTNDYVQNMMHVLV